MDFGGNTGRIPAMKMDKLSNWIRGTVGQGAKPKSFENKPHRQQPQAQKHAPVHKNVMRVIPIGGLEEVGKNSMVIEYEDDIICIDMGFQFPENDMLGVDYIIPDVKYLKERKGRLKAIVVTHGHLDHIGAIPYVYADLGYPPIYCSKLTSGLISRQLEEHKLLKQAKFVLIDAKQPYRIGKFELDFFRVNHSIPDAYGLAIRSPEGTIVHTGDFKFDFTPADGVLADIPKIATIGRRGVNALFSDSTNSTKPGHTMSEKIVGQNLESSIADAKGRIIIASFSSLIGRIQQIIDYAEKHGRKIFLSGRSMDENMKVAHKMGYLKIPGGIVQAIKDVNKFPDEKILILSTGSQGEPMSALSRMATGSHMQVKISKGDTVVVSSSPIIGNEKASALLIDQLARRGAVIVHNKIMDVHTSGHGQQEDLKMMITLIKPDHLVPVHGNFYMREVHAGLGPLAGVKEANVHVIDDGDVLEFRKGKLEFKKENIKVNYIVVDGMGLGELGSQVSQERESMSKNGIVVITMRMRGSRFAGNSLVTVHGFVYQKEAATIVNEIEKEVKNAYFKLLKRDKNAKVMDFENYIRSHVASYILRRLDRRPLVSTVIVNV